MKYMNECMNEWINQSINQSINQWIIEPMDHWITKQELMNDLVSRWVNESVNSVNHWMNGAMHRWCSDCVNQWISDQRMKRNEIEWNEVKWSEPEWNEMKCGEKLLFALLFNALSNLSSCNPARLVTISLKARRSVATNRSRRAGNGDDSVQMRSRQLFCCVFSLLSSRCTQVQIFAGHPWVIRSLYFSLLRRLRLCEIQLLLLQNAWQSWTFWHANRALATVLCTVCPQFVYRIEACSCGRGNSHITKKNTGFCARECFYPWIHTLPNWTLPNYLMMGGWHDDVVD